MTKPKKILIANLAVLGFVSFSFGREFVYNHQIQKQINDLKTKEAELVSTNIELAELNQRILTEDFLEREARLKLGLRKSGESLVIVGDDSFLTGQGALDDLEENNKKHFSNPARWWKFFFN